MDESTEIENRIVSTRGEEQMENCRAQGYFGEGSYVLKLERGHGVHRACIWDYSATHLRRVKMLSFIFVFLILIVNRRKHIFKLDLKDSFL